MQHLDKPVSRAYPRTAAPDDELVFLPLGGAGEIGMNMNLYGYGPEDDYDWLMIDCGVAFGQDNGLGVDAVMPDPTYIEERADRLLAIVLTHGHEDHLGAVAHLWRRLRCPVYATPFTAALLRHKLNEARLIDEVDLRILPLGGKATIGPFEIELITLTHSIPEPNAVAIRTPLGVIMHTGDWKIDPSPIVGDVTDEAALRALGDEGVLAMVCDSTNVFQEGVSGSEDDVRTSLVKLIGGIKKGAVAVTSFASNLARLESVVHAAHKSGRSVVVVGRAFHTIIGAAREAGFLADMPRLLGEAEAQHIPADNLLYLCTGSQGQPRAALDRISRGEHRHVKLGKGDTIIFSSRMIPGNEKSIYALQDRLTDLGAAIITDGEILTHVSGHPCRDELAQMYRWVRPQVSIPVHGERRHMAEHGRLADSLQVPQSLIIENGLMSRLAPGRPEVVDEVPSGRLALDGRTVVEADGKAQRDRAAMATAGLAVVNIILDGSGRLACDPILLLEGMPEQVAARLVAETPDIVRKFAGGRTSADDEEHLAEMVRREVRKRLAALWGKKPMTRVSVTRL
ncbi:MAG: beta-lactamase domain protein [Caulobacter sp.]|nr:beta-lactamase domain protein [Caulobacter sp.]